MNRINLLTVIAAMALFVLAACSSKTEYNRAEADKLTEKVVSGAELTQDDYDAMITQCEGAAEIIGDKFDTLLELKQKGDAKKLAEAFESCTDKEIMAAANNFQTLGEHLNSAPLDSVNARRWEEFQPKAQELVTKMFAVFQ